MTYSLLNIAIKVLHFQNEIRCLIWHQSGVETTVFLPDYKEIIPCKSLGIRHSFLRRQKNRLEQRLPYYSSLLRLV